MNCIERAKQTLRNKYHSIWEDWYKGKKGIKPARLIIRVSDHDSSFYDKNQDILYLNLPRSNLEDVLKQEDGDNRSLNIDPLGWPAWKRELIHEMMHEYQHKIVKGHATTEGDQLYRKYSKYRLSDSKHGADFYTAVSNLAPYFNMTPDKLARNL